MLTCFNGATNLVFQKILRFFIKENSKILDITYGRGFSWINLKEKHNLIKIDKRKMGGDVLNFDFNEYLPKQDSSSFDCIYFDPPYYFREKIKDFDIRNQMFNKEKEIFWTEQEFNKSLNTLRNEIPRILKENGIIIIKIMDGYVGKNYYPNTFKVFNSLSDVLKPLGTFICPIQRKDSFGFVRCNHINYLIFKKGDKNEL